MDDPERHPWERREGESNRWFRRFESFRLMGPSRSLIACVNREKVSKGLQESRYTPGSWRKQAVAFDWRARAEAWDQHLIDAAAAAAEAQWRAHVMGKTEVLGRLSEHGRVDISRFFKTSERWTDEPLPSEEILGEETYTAGAGEEAEERTHYKVRRIVLDMDALMDPDLARYVKKFSDNPRSGLSIELVDGQGALVHMGKYHGLFTDRSLNIDLSKLTDDQLQRISAGEDIIHVLANPGTG